MLLEIKLRNSLSPFVPSLNEDGVAPDARDERLVCLDIRSKALAQGIDEVERDRCIVRTTLQQRRPITFPFRWGPAQYAPRKVGNNLADASVLLTGDRFRCCRDVVVNGQGCAHHVAHKTSSIAHHIVPTKSARQASFRGGQLRPAAPLHEVAPHEAHVASRSSCARENSGCKISDARSRNQQSLASRGAASSCSAFRTASAISALAAGTKTWS